MLIVFTMFQFDWSIYDQDRVIRIEKPLKLFFIISKLTCF